MFARILKLGQRTVFPGGLIAAIFLTATVTGANAQAPTYDLQGTWSSGPLVEGARAPANGTQVVTQMNMTTGEFSGHSEVDGVQFELKGIESGTALEYTQTEGSYVAHDKVPVLSVLPDGNVGGNGSFEAGEFWMEVVSSSTSIEKEAQEKEAKKKAEETKKKEKEANAKRPTATSVVCDYEFATSENTCVASVGDAGPGTPVTPTGSVTFTTTSGGFSSGASCALSPTPGSPSVASCSLVYETMESGLPSITATYGGDARHTPSAGQTQFLGSGPEETSTEEAPAKPGEYPNEVKLETEVPAPGTTVEADLQPEDPLPLPVAIDFVLPPANMDATASEDVLRTDLLLADVELDDGQSQQLDGEANQSLVALDQQQRSAATNPAPASQADAQQIQKDMQELDGVYQQLTKQGQDSTGAPQDSQEAAKRAVLAKEVEEALKSSSETLKKNANKAFEAWDKAIVSQNRQGAAAAIASTKRHTHRRLLHYRRLAFAAKQSAPAGKLALALKVSPAALAKLAGHHSSLTLVLRVRMILPSATIHGGLPRMFVKRVTLRRAPGHASKHRRHKRR